MTTHALAWLGKAKPSLLLLIVIFIFHLLPYMTFTNQITCPIEAELTRLKLILTTSKKWSFGGSSYGHQKGLGAEHPHTLTSMANLASTYRNQRRWNEAEKLELEVMNIKMRLGRK